VGKGREEQRPEVRAQRSVKKKSKGKSLQVRCRKLAVRLEGYVRGFGGKRVTVVGCGLIGASFALAVKESGACGRVAGWDARPEVLEEALGRGVIDEIDSSFGNSEIDPSFRNGPPSSRHDSPSAGDGRQSSSDLLYLAMPVSAILEFLRNHGGRIRPGTTVTDAGSTKLDICRVASKYLSDEILFVGGHPIAGSQHAGLAHARAGLFKDAPYILIEDGKQNDERFIALKETLSSIGARVYEMEAEAHDRAMALVSHLPQLISSAISATVKERPEAEELLKITGGGYRDMTRLAASPWEMWRDILATNRGPVAGALNEVIERLTAVRMELEDGAGDLLRAKELFEAAGK
jgi:prephenate dehydrogenase